MHLCPFYRSRTGDFTKLFARTCEIRRWRLGILNATVVCAMFGAALTPALTDARDEGEATTEEAPHALSIPLAALVQAVRNALADARRYNEEAPYFLVRSVQLDLTVIQRETVDGGVAFEVPVLPLEVSAGGSLVTEATEALSMTLKPAPQTLVSAAEKINLGELMEAVKTALPAGAGSGGFRVPKLTYTKQFYLQTTGGGGINFVVKAGAEVSEASTQRVEFEMCQTVDLLDCVE